jgi:hypothetical protein
MSPEGIKRIPIMSPTAEARRPLLSLSDPHSQLKISVHKMQEKFDTMNGKLVIHVEDYKCSCYEFSLATFKKTTLTYSSVISMPWKKNVRHRLPTNGLGYHQCVLYLSVTGTTFQEQEEPHRPCSRAQNEPVHGMPCLCSCSLSVEGFHQQNHETMHDNHLHQLLLLGNGGSSTWKGNGNHAKPVANSAAMAARLAPYSCIDAKRGSHSILAYRIFQVNDALCPERLQRFWRCHRTFGFALKV